MIDYQTYAAGEANDILVMKVTGRLDNDTSRFFLGCVEDQVEDGHTRIVIDCGLLEFISSLGVGTLVRLQSRLKRKGGIIKLANVQNMVADLLRIVRMDLLFQIYPNVDAAVTSFA